MVQEIFDDAARVSENSVRSNDLINAIRFKDIKLFGSILEIAGSSVVNGPDEEGMTALHHAAASGARPFIRLLVKNPHCDYLVRDNKGRYASDLAIEYAGDHAVGRLLTKHQLRQANERGVPAWEPANSRSKNRSPSPQST